LTAEPACGSFPNDTVSQFHQGAPINSGYDFSAGFDILNYLSLEHRPATIEVRHWEIFYPPSPRTVAR
jgi:hypothetical protein